MVNNIEIEIKSLLWKVERKNKLLEDAKSIFTKFELISKEKQLNHYFNTWDFWVLFEKLKSFLNEIDIIKFKDITENWKNHSVRTRRVDNWNKVIFVIKAAIDDTTSHNWISRIEFEANFNSLNLEQLDNILIESWFDYLSKWSREREEYQLDEIHLCLDKNAWYWYVAEFEIVVSPEDNYDEKLNYVKSIMDKLWAEELPQDRLWRMFDYYNNNWRDYYGTENVFVIE